MSIASALKHKIGNALQFIDMYRGIWPYASGAIFTFRVDVVTLSFQIPAGDERVSLLYVGRRRNLAYVTNKLRVDTNAQVVESQRANLLTFRKKMSKLQGLSDVIVLDIGWPYHGFINRHGDYLELPELVNMAVPTNTDWEIIKRNFRGTTRKRELRLIRRHQYHCESTNDSDTIKNFYDDYYLPFVNFRHADDVVLDSRKDIEKYAQEGVILKVMGSNGPVAAGVVCPEDGILQCLWVGMPAELVKNPAEGALSTFNYFCIRYAFDQNLQAADFAGTRSFPADGLFQSKRKWGPILEDSITPSSILIKPANHTLKAAIFFEHCPVVVRRDGQLELVTCVTTPECDESVCKKILSKFFCEGISQVTIVHISDQHEEISVYPSSKYPNVRVVSCNLENFPQCYAHEFDIGVEEKIND